MPSFSYTSVKWPAEYHPDRLPPWLNAAQRQRCNDALRVKVSTDRSVVVVMDSNGREEWLSKRDGR